MNKNKDIENLTMAIQKKDGSIERYSSQIKAFSDPKINTLLEGILHNEMRHKAELEEHLNRLSS
jgi:rubrerythrin